MGLQRTDAPLGPPVERFKYPHFFFQPVSTLTRGARVRQGGPRLYLLFTSFLVLFPVEPSGTGIGWLSLKESFEQPPYAVDRPMVGRLGCNGGLARVQFPTSGLSGSCETVSAILETQNLAGKQNLSRLFLWALDRRNPSDSSLSLLRESNSRFYCEQGGRRILRTLWWYYLDFDEVGRGFVESTRKCRAVELSPNGRLLMVLVREWPSLIPRLTT